jgi:hypothetical protein
MSRFVEPAEVRIPLTGGDYLIVKGSLNTGDTLDMFARMYRAPAPAVCASCGAIGELAGDAAKPDQVDPLQVGIATVTAYLIDWSLTDPAGRIVSVRDQPIGVVTAALRGLEYADYQEVLTAIQAHERTLEAARAEKKTRRDGPIASDPASRSLAAVAGGMNG